MNKKIFFALSVFLAIFPVATSVVLAFARATYSYKHPLRHWPLSDSRLRNIELSILPLLLIAGIFAATSPTISQAGSATTISAVVLPGEDSCSCGSHGGSFNAMYNNRKISISFSFNPTPANPVKHPIVVIKDNRQVEHWDSLICSSNCGPIGGSTVTIDGRWERADSCFEAYRIELPSSFFGKPSFDCGQAKTPSEIAICNNAGLSQMDRELASLYRSHIKECEDDFDMVKKLRGTQNSWLTERNQCGSNVSCLQARYQDRIKLLNVMMWIEAYKDKLSSEGAGRAAAPAADTGQPPEPPQSPVSDPGSKPAWPEPTPLFLVLDGIEFGPTLDGIVSTGVTQVRTENYLAAALKQAWGDKLDFYSVPWGGGLHDDGQLANYLSLSKAQLCRVVQQAVGRPVVVIGHSWGSVVGYQAIKALETEPCPGGVPLASGAVDLFVSMGSPLGSDFIEQTVKVIPGTVPGQELLGKPITKPSTATTWVNIAVNNDLIAANIPVADANLRWDAGANAVLRPAPFAYTYAHSAYYERQDLVDRLAETIKRLLPTSQTAAPEPPAAPPVAEAPRQVGADPAAARIELKDGNVLIGAIQASKVPFTSSFGAVEVDLGEVRGFSDGSLRLSDGTVLKGRFDKGSLEMSTKRGRIKVSLPDVVSIGHPVEEAKSITSSVLGEDVRKPTNSEIEKLLRDELQGRSIPITWLRNTGGSIHISGGAIGETISEIEVKEWGAFNKRGQYWPARVRITGSAKVTGPDQLYSEMVGGPKKIVQFNIIDNFEFSKDDYGKLKTHIDRNRWCNNTCARAHGITI